MNRAVIVGAGVLGLMHAVEARWRGLGLRPHGSLTLAADDAELAPLKEATAAPDAAERGYELLDPPAACEVSPALTGAFAGALLSRRDAIVVGDRRGELRVTAAAPVPDDPRTLEHR